MELIKARQVRFARLVEVGGQPEAYLPFSDPEKDKTFIRAAKGVRVVTINQEPTAKRKDFGVVGYVKQKYATYLVFLKTLKALAGRRVIGIDYNALKTADVRIGGKAPRMRKPLERAKPKRGILSEGSASKAAKQEKTRPKPQPKTFRVDVRVTTTAQRQIEVRAWNANEARSNALREIEQAASFDPERMSVRTLRVRRQ